MTPKEKHAHLLPQRPTKTRKKKREKKKKKENTQTTQQVLHNVDFIVTHLCKSFLLSLWWGKEALGILILGGKEKKIFYSLLFFLFFSFLFLFLLWQAFANQAKLCNVSFGHHVFHSTKDFGEDVGGLSSLYPQILLNLLLCRALIKGIQGKFAIHVLCMHFWKSLCNQEGRPNTPSLTSNISPDHSLPPQPSLLQISCPPKENLTKEKCILFHPLQHS